MALEASRVRRSGPPPRERKNTWFSWWVSPSASLVWRLPLLVTFALIGGWYIFRGLVRMAFIFDANAIGSFLLAPLLLPLAALPAACFWFALRILPRVWRDPRIGAPTKALNTVAMLPATTLLAAFLDVIETMALVQLRIPMPGLLFSQLPVL